MIDTPINELKELIEKTYKVKVKEIFKTQFITYIIRYKVIGLNEYFQADIDCDLRDNLEFLENFKNDMLLNIEEYLYN